MSESLLSAEPTEAAPEPAAETVTETAAETPERLDFVLDKYRAEGKTESEAALEQAKGYSEIRKQLGDFKGAPDEYEITLSDELKDAGMELDADSPLLEGVSALAKEMNMSQDGLNKLVGLYIENQMAETQAMEGGLADEMKALGSNGTARVEGINKYISANFDEDTVAAIQGMATTSESIKAIESMIGKSQGSPLGDIEVTPTPSVTETEVREMQFALDDFGNRKINTDPSFRKLYQQKSAMLWGNAEHNVTIG
jgi:hypothetical protein